MRTFKNQMQAFAIKQLLKYVERDPEVNAAKALKIIRKIDLDGTYGSSWDELEKCLQDPGNNWTRLVKKAYTEWDPHVRKKLFESLICNAAIIGNSAVKETSKKYGVHVPWTILMDPTSACNLKCTGCWAAEYGHQMSMDLETLDRIITEAKALGIYMFIFSGGEPLVRKKDIIKLCEKHTDCYFLAFTNGTLIDEAFADDMLRVGNFAPAISVEGYEEETDMRRGKGTFKAVMKAMEILKRKRLLFGMSTCYHRKNVDVVGSSEYLDFMIDQGAAFVWYFTYMPVGNDAVPELMVTSEQRKFMYEQVRMFRKTKPIFAMDFWNDGEYVRGCIAGGRYYFHINANGDVEPCAFIHYSTVNIKQVSLLEALRSPLFKAYQQRQPFNKNHLRPCPLLDNPHSLKEVVRVSEAYSTDMLKPEDAEYVWIVYFVPEKLADKIDAIYASMHFERCFLPDEYEGTPMEAEHVLDDRIKALEAEKQEVEGKILQTLDENKKELAAARTRLERFSVNFDVRKMAACTKHGDHTFYILCGWMSETDAKKFQKEIESDADTFCIMEDNHNNIMSTPPTKMKNPGLFKPFEMYVEMYGLPSYNEIDPTILIGITYSILFGFMFGDAGQGLCLLIGGFLLY